MIGCPKPLHISLLLMMRALATTLARSVWVASRFVVERRVWDSHLLVLLEDGDTPLCLAYIVHLLYVAITWHSAARGLNTFVTAFVNVGSWHLSSTISITEVLSCHRSLFVVRNFNLILGLIVHVRLGLYHDIRGSVDRLVAVWKAPLWLHLMAFVAIFSSIDEELFLLVFLVPTRLCRCALNDCFDGVLLGWFNRDLIFWKDELCPSWLSVLWSYLRWFMVALDW